MKDWRLFFWVCEDSRTSDLCLSSPFLCLSSLCLSCHSCLSLSLSPSPPLSLSLSLSLMSLSNIHDTFAIPPSPPPLRPPLFLCPPLSLLSPRFSLSSFCLIAFSLVGVSRVACGVRAARCQSRRVLGVSRVVRSHRVVRSLASLRRLSSRVVCRLASSVVSRRLSSRVIASSVVSPRLSSRLVSLCVVQLLGVSRVVCGVVLVSVASRRASSRCSVSVASCAESCRPPLSLCVVRSHRVVRSLASSGRLSCCVVCVMSSCVVPLLCVGVSRVVRSACESRPFFLFRLDG